jgi:hypothetical protein
MARVHPEGGNLRIIWVRGQHHEVPAFTNRWRGEYNQGSLSIPRELTSAKANACYRHCLGVLKERGEVELPAPSGTPFEILTIASAIVANLDEWIDKPTDGSRLDGQDQEDRLAAAAELLRQVEAIFVEGQRERLTITAAAEDIVSACRNLEQRAVSVHAQPAGEDSDADNSGDRDRDHVLTRKGIVMRFPPDK